MIRNTLIVLVGACLLSCSKPRTTPQCTSFIGKLVVEYPPAAEFKSTIRVLKKGGGAPLEIGQFAVEKSKGRPWMLILYVTRFRTLTESEDPLPGGERMLWIAYSYPDDGGGISSGGENYKIPCSNYHFKEIRDARNGQVHLVTFTGNDPTDKHEYLIEIPK